MDETLARIERALDYVESQLFGDLSLAALAARAGWSPWHFHRLFVALAGLTPAEYVRRRRFTEICRRVGSGDEPLVAVALDCGFESQASFTRAFTRQIGVAPGRYRKERSIAPAHAFPRLDVATLLARLERKHMEPRIERKDAIHAVGLAGRFAPFDPRIPELWSRFVTRLEEIDHRRGAHTLGICIDDPSGDAITYVAAVEVERIDAVPAGMIALTLPARCYAVWTHRGPIARFGDTMKQVFGRWLPDSKLEHAAAPDFEYYDERFDPVGGGGEVDIYVPIESQG